MKKHIFSLLLLSGLVFSIFAQEIPAGYYSDAVGEKGVALKTALHYIIKDADELSYGAARVVPGRDLRKPTFVPTERYGICIPTGALRPNNSFTTVWKWMSSGLMSAAKSVEFSLFTLIIAAQAKLLHMFGANAILRGCDFLLNRFLAFESS